MGVDGHIVITGVENQVEFVSAVKKNSLKKPTATHQTETRGNEARTKDKIG